MTVEQEHTLKASCKQCQHLCQAHTHTHTQTHKPLRLGGHVSSGAEANWCLPRDIVSGTTTGFKHSSPLTISLQQETAIKQDRERE